MKKGFTMIELIFVIVILGILAAVAIPRLAGTRADAEITSTIANIRTFLSDAATFYVAKGSFFEGEAQTGTNNTANANGTFAKWRSFTNVPLLKSAMGSTDKIDDTTDIGSNVVLPVGGKPCIVIGIADPGYLSNNYDLLSAVVLFGHADSSNSSLCNAVKNTEAVKAFTHNVLLKKDGTAYNFSNSSSMGITTPNTSGSWTGAIGVGSSASVYDLNFSK